MAYIEPYTGAWSTDEAAHLGRRAAFGFRPDEQASRAAIGLSDSVDALVDYPAQDAALDAAIQSLPTTADNDLIRNPTGKRSLQGWWVFRMVYGNQPLQEQLTLFLHDTLVSEWAKVASGVSTNVNNGNDGSITGQTCTTGTLAPDSSRRGQIILRLMRDQNELLRQEGSGAYEELLRLVTRDPAMLIYLDNRLNIKGKAQENYAREIMELFSMGVGNYTEQDVQEIARAFTGETINTSCAADFPYNYLYNAAQHDTNSKTVFADTFNFAGAGQDTDHVISLIVNRISGASVSPAHSTLPATAVYMAWKLITWFVNEAIPIDHPAVPEFADYFYNNQPNGYRYDVREFLRALLKSQLFWDPAYRHTMYKSPADFLAMSLRMLEVRETSFSSQVGSYLNGMGMDLLEPPNVGGWLHGTPWINSGSIIRRYNYGNRLSGTSIATDAYCDAFTTNAIVSGTTDHAGLVEFFRARLIQTDLRPSDQSVLMNFLQVIESGSGSATSKFRRKVRGLIHLVMATPQYQLK